jgi:murein DD-endopeptidase MepM/ murein hydrolase activator NlpD
VQHDSTFIINDVRLEIPPTQISVNKNASLRELKALRTKSSIKTKSGKATISVSLDVFFVGADDINNKLRPLLAQFVLTPFCYVENQYLRDEILGEEGQEENMALALQNITVNTVPGHPDTFNVRMHFLWFNYKPYTPNFYFKNMPFISLPQRQPGVAFKLFYLPQLQQHDTVTLQNSDVELSLYEFLIGPADKFDDIKEMSLDLSQPNLDRFQQLLDEYLNTIEKLQSTDRDDIDSENIVLDVLTDISIRFAGEDPSLSTLGGINQTIHEAGRLTALFQDKKIQVGQEDEDLKRLLVQQRNLVDLAGQIFLDGDVWLEFPQDLLGGTNKFGINETSKLYFRRRSLLMGKDRNGFIVEQMALNFGHLLSVIPMAGYQYPTAQHMGSSDMQIGLKISVLNDAAHRALTTFWNVYNNNIHLGRFIPQEYTNVFIKNEIAQFAGIKEVMIQGSGSVTVPNYPGTYNVTIDFIEAGIRPGEIEGIKAIPTSFNNVRKLIWKAIWNNLKVTSQNSKPKRLSVKDNVDVTSGLDYKNFFRLVPQEGLFQAEEIQLNTVARRIEPLAGQMLFDLQSSNWSTKIESAYDGKQSTGLRNLVILSGITDDEVYGVEGLTNAFWQASSTIFTHDISKDPSILTQREELGSRQKSINERHIDSKQEEYKKLQKAHEIYQEFLAAKQLNPNQAESTLRAVRADGSVIDLAKELKLIGLDKDFRDRVIQEGKQELQGIRLTEDVNIGLLTRAARAVTGGLLDDRIERYGQNSFIERYMKNLEKELQDLEFEHNAFGSVGSVADQIFGAPSGSPFQAFARSFRHWPEFTRAVADQIIHSDAINFDIFKEASEALADMQALTSGKIYHDFPMREIESNIRNILNLSYPDEVTIEPDFYFINETADLGANDFINPEEIEQTREFVSNYADRVVQNDTSWYNDYYKQQHDAAYQSLLDKSSQKNVLESKYRGISSVSASTSLNKPTSVTEQSTNNQLSIEGKPLLNQRNQGTLNRPLNNTPKVESVIENFQDNQDYIVNIPNTVIASHAEESEAIGLWVMPLAGAPKITSVPGFRNPAYKGASSYHKGVDLAYVGETFGKPVFAAAEAEVYAIRTWDGSTTGAGNYVGLRSNTNGEIYFHKYMHLSRIAGNISVGDIVQRGQLIGFVGNSGTRKAHLHFEVRRGRISGEIIWPFGSYEPKEMHQDPNDPIASEPLIPWIGSEIPVTSIPEVSSQDRGMSMFEMALSSMKKDLNSYSGYRMNRAYPGIYLAFIEENIAGPLLVFDGFFSYQSILGLEMVRDREVAADFCRLTLSNVSGVLSNRKFDGTYLENKIVNREREARKTTRQQDKGTLKETEITSMMLTEGMKVEIKLGYSNSPKNLADIFVGRIVSVQNDETSDVIHLEIQSLATELVQDIKHVDKAKELNSFMSNDAYTGDLLWNLMSSPEVVSFGAWKRGDHIGNTNRGLLSERWLANPNPQTDNIFCPPLHEMEKFESGVGSNWRDYAGAAVGGVAGATLGPVGAAAGALFGWKLRLDRLKYRLYQMTIWDVFKEMELRHPEWVASPVPYTEAGGSRKRMTMFFGLPDQLYYARDPSPTENRKAEDIRNKKKEITARVQEALRTGGRAIDIVAETLENSSLDREEARAVVEKMRSRMSTGSSVDLIGGGSKEHENKVRYATSEALDRYVESELLKEALESSAIRPFRNYHILTSKQHIVSNSIRAKSSNTFNAVTVQYSSSGDVDLTSHQGNQINDASTITLKLDPQIPDENIRENFFIYPNCQGEEMAKSYALSLLQKGVWYTYSGELVILGNPNIKPYDICYIFDEYSDMRGPIQVRRIAHYFSHETGFISVITPDMIAYTSEGATLSQNQAMGLMAEAFLKKTLQTDKINLVTPGRTPLDGAQTTPIMFELAVAGTRLVNFFGGRRLIFRTQFGQPIRVYPLFQNGKPMVAGFGPPHLRKNLFFMNDLRKEINESLTGLNEWMDDFANRLNDGIFFNTQGRLFGDETAKRTTVRIRR